MQNVEQNRNFQQNGIVSKKKNADSWTSAKPRMCFTKQQCYLKDIKMRNTLGSQQGLLRHVLMAILATLGLSHQREQHLVPAFGKSRNRSEGCGVSRFANRSRSSPPASRAMCLQ